MDKTKAFLNIKRCYAGYRPVSERIKDFKDVALVRKDAVSQEQASRCMECGTPFCHWGCPLANIIPEMNDLLFRGQWEKAFMVLQSANNFPEITARVCPAVCEYACVLGVNDEPVSIRENELAVIEYAFKKGFIRPRPPKIRTGKKIAVIGSGPAGLACADQLNKMGHNVTVYEKDDRIGGILRYGIPDFKLEKRIIDRRLKILEKEGIIFNVNYEIDEVDPRALILSSLGKEKDKEKFDVVCLAIGAREPRDLKIEGRDLNGVYFAMEYLTQSNKKVMDDNLNGNKRWIDAKGKNVIVIGGGDTGSDCVGTANRQGARSVTQIEILPKPPESRTDKMPWPTYPMILKTSTSHEEGCVRKWSTQAKKITGDGNKVREVVCETEGKEHIIKADLVILAMGFIHPVHNRLLSGMGVEFDNRGNIKTNENCMTSVNGVFSAGDCHRGASLVAWAIKEGRETAEGINKYLAKAK